MKESAYSEDLVKTVNKTLMKTSFFYQKFPYSQRTIVSLKIKRNNILNVILWRRS